MSVHCPIRAYFGVCVTHWKAVCFGKAQFGGRKEMVCPSDDFVLWFRTHDMMIVHI